MLERKEFVLSVVCCSWLRLFPLPSLAGVFQGSAVEERVLCWFSFCARVSCGYFCVGGLCAFSFYSFGCSFECDMSEGWLFFEPFKFFFCRRDAVRSDKLGFEGCEGL